jgi:antitoxin CptB
MGADAELGRLRWRCRRGMRELDQLLTRWLEMRWPQASAVERKNFERLLEVEDDQLQRWCMGRERPDSKELHALVDQLRTLSSS